MWAACGVDDNDTVTVKVTSDSVGRLVHVGLGELRLVLTPTQAEQLRSRLGDALTDPGQVTAECRECGHPFPLDCSPDLARGRQCTDRLDWYTGRARVRA